MSQRTLQVKVLKPDRGLARDIPEWLQLYEEGRLKVGAIEEESFTIYMNPSTNSLAVTDSELIPSPTATFLVEEEVCWQLAARTESVYSAYIKGYPLRVVGEFKIRDMELVDEILDSFYEIMKADGKDIAELFAR